MAEMSVEVDELSGVGGVAVCGEVFVVLGVVLAGGVKSYGVGERAGDQVEERPGYQGARSSLMLAAQW